MNRSRIDVTLQCVSLLDSLPKHPKEVLYGRQPFRNLKGSLFVVVVTTPYCSKLQPIRPTRFRCLKCALVTTQSGSPLLQHNVSDRYREIKIGEVLVKGILPRELLAGKSITGPDSAWLIRLIFCAEHLAGMDSCKLHRFIQQYTWVHDFHGFCLFLLIS